MARKKARRPNDRAYRVLRAEVARLKPGERDALFRRAWTFIVRRRLRRLFGLPDTDAENDDA